MMLIQVVTTFAFFIAYVFGLTTIVIGFLSLFEKFRLFDMVNSMFIVVPFTLIAFGLYAAGLHAILSKVEVLSTLKFGVYCMMPIIFSLLIIYLFLKDIRIGF